MVSIIIPTYNRASLIERSVWSVLTQTYPDFELLIVDDGSKDNTEEVIKNIKDDRIRYIKLPENRGVSAARNEGVRQSSFSYIAFQDSDDCWRADKLEKQMRVMSEKSEEIGLVYGNYLYHSVDGEEFVVPPADIPRKEKEGDLFKNLLVRNIISPPTLLIKKTCIDAAGGFDEKVRCLEDHEWILRVARLYKIAYIDEVLADVYATKGSVSDSYIRYFEARCLIIGLYRKQLLEHDLFNRAVGDLLAKAEQVDCKEEVVKCLERILSV